MFLVFLSVVPVVHTFFQLASTGTGCVLISYCCTIDCDKILSSVCSSLLLCDEYIVHWILFDLTAGISGVKSREDLVMSNTDLSTVDPFSAAPFKPPAGLFLVACCKYS